MNDSLLNRDPLDLAITECPFDYYHALREDGGVFQVPDRNFFLVSRYDLVMQVVKDTDTFSSKTGVQVPSAADGSHRPREGIVRTLLTADPPEHRFYRNLAFSQGVHFCPGAPLARLESAIAFEQLFERLQNFQLDESRSDLRHLPSFTHRSLRKVQITFDRTVTATTR